MIFMSGSKQQPEVETNEVGFIQPFWQLQYYPSYFALIF